MSDPVEASPVQDFVRFVWTHEPPVVPGLYWCRWHCFPGYFGVPGESPMTRAPTPMIWGHRWRDGARSDIKEAQLAAKGTWNDKGPQGTPELKAMLCGTAVTGPACTVVECRVCGWKSGRLHSDESVAAISEHMMTHNAE